MTVSLLIDIITIALLSATIVYAFTLNRRIQLIHNNRDELRTLLNGFSSALARAEVSVEKLKSSGQEAIVVLEGSLDEARTIRDDLQFLVDRGEQVANSLEDGIRHKRDDAISFPAHLGAASTTLDGQDNFDHNIEPSDEMVISEVKKKLIGRLKTLR